MSFFVMQVVTHKRCKSVNKGQLTHTCVEFVILQWKEDLHQIIINQCQSCMKEDLDRKAVNPTILAFNIYATAI